MSRAALLFRNIKLGLCLTAAAALPVATAADARDGNSAALKKREGLLKIWRRNHPSNELWDAAFAPRMIIVPSGSFSMGSPDGEEGRDSDEGPLHRVSIGHDFAMGKYLVTREEFALFMAEAGHKMSSDCYGWTGWKFKERPDTGGWRNPGFKQGEQEPAVCINWHDAQAYAEWLSRKTGKKYRLPSEAEWEYAERAGSDTARWWGNSADAGCKKANVADLTLKTKFTDWRYVNCSDGYIYTSPVDAYSPNGFGLYDMLGNAWQWTQDCYNKTYEGAPQDGSAWLTGDCSRRVLRGGAWVDANKYVRSANRGPFDPGYRSYIYGFRIVRDL